MSSPASATPPLHPANATEQILAASGVPLIAWRSQLPKLQQRQGVLGDELQPSLNEELADRWTRLLERLPHVSLARIIAASGITLHAILATATLPAFHVIGPTDWRQEYLLAPSWTATLQLLGHVSEEQLRQWTPAHIVDAVQQTMQQKQLVLSALQSRIEVDGAALMMLEAQSDLPSDLVNIVAQYVNSDFERPHPYSSIFKQEK